ncbi:hypothetical protein F0562_020918 [Nyssa sinensis]|uniref:Uncharacterized protein n=1 Tax=Nyssa sinensis TaxID=561372 RepID=A0A5J5BTN1_9ASTE|nr:hypothetical protein F0562_020918 [Nyssa sinensis]
MALSSNNIVSLSHKPTLIPLTFHSLLKLQKNPNPTPFKLHPLFLSHHPPIHSNSPIFTISASSSTAPDVDAVDFQKHNNSLTSDSTITNRFEFARNLSGEWDGYGADFTSEGNPIELPENVVPEAYREWEVKVFDWQTQCPTLAKPDDFSVTYKLIKLLPTVGCEADAATRHSVDERHIGGADNSVSAFAYQSSSGCYVAVWPMGDHRLLELEHCLIDPRNRESRVRIIQVVRVEKTNKLVLKNIKIFCEQWYGPFRNGEQLGGCAIRDSAFASTEALSSSQVTGVWQGLNAVATFQNSENNILQELSDDSVRKSERDECNLILLPKQLWCSVKEREDNETCCEVGWLLDQGSAITSKCIFSSNAGLKVSEIAYVSMFLLKFLSQHFLAAIYQPQAS